MSSPVRISDPITFSLSENLPIDLWAAIAKRLTSITDYLSFRGVCRRLRSAATFDNFDRAFPRVPWLMFFPKETEKEKKEEDKRRIDGDGITNFWDPESKTCSKITNLPPPVGFPYLSWSGWILHVSSDSVDVSLTHPIWRIKIELPCLNTLPEHKQQPQEGNKPNPVIRKMVLSGSPTIKIDLVVMVIWGDQHQVAFSRPGDYSWTVMDSWGDSFSDIIYHNRRLYAVDSRMRVVECDVHGPNPTQLRQVFIFDPDFVPDKEVVHYLVESSGKFLIVSRRFVSQPTAITTDFQVFEIDLRDGSHTEIDDLGNRALFLGSNSSICVELSNWSKVEPNCIYYTVDVGRCEFTDIGIYKLLDMKFHICFDGILEAISSPPARVWPTLPTWVVPSF